MAGLVAITPCAGFVGSLASIPIGMLAGIVCFLAISLGLKAARPKGIRVSSDDEEAGLDVTQHSETAYAFERV